jgi:RNA polymerase sigma-70 factor, ECF subfamily
VGPDTKEAMLLAAELPMVESERTTPAGAAAKMRAKDTPSFESIYSKQFDFVWRSVLRLGVAEAHAEDVAQEVFVVVHRRLESFESRSSVKTWIFGIVRGVVRNHRRSDQRRQAREAIAEELRVVEADGPDEALARRQAKQVLYAILDELDESRREVFVLAELEQMPVVEIAEALEENLNTVYSRLRLARQQFAKAAERQRARDGWRTQ